MTDEINQDKFALTVPYRFEIFQDLFDENQRKRIDIINFLLWNKAKSIKTGTNHLNPILLIYTYAQRILSKLE